MKNPQAFPRPSWGTGFGQDNRDNDAHEGMTLLDYFAGQALKGILLLPEVKSISASQNDRVAEMCYCLAKSMLKERENHID